MVDRTTVLVELDRVDEGYQSGVQVQSEFADGPESWLCLMRACKRR